MIEIILTALFIMIISILVIIGKLNEKLQNLKKQLDADVRVNYTMIQMLGKKVKTLEEIGEKLKNKIEKKEEK